MNKNTHQLFEAAKRAQACAYSPYSSFKVGAALIANDEQTYVGCNVENAAYPLGQCAEAGAISTMIVNGASKIKHIGIVSPNESFCPPCGGCRQKIKEFAQPDTQVTLFNNLGEQKTMTFAELLPLAFDLD